MVDLEYGPIAVIENERDPDGFDFGFIRLKNGGLVPVLDGGMVQLALDELGGEIVEVREIHDGDRIPVR
jgi:hypothetical protein